MFLEADELQVKYFLKYNFADKEETCQRWKECINIRHKHLTECKDPSIANIIDSWPAYKQTFGADLVKLKYIYLYMYI